MSRISTLHMAGGVGLKQAVPVPFGLNVEEIAMRVHGSTEALCAYVRAPIGCVEEWIEIDRDRWRLIRPKCDDCIMFGYRLHGGGLLKSVFAIASAVIVAASTLVFGPLGGVIAGIGLGLVSSLLFPPSSSQASEAGPTTRARQFSNADSDSNILAKGTAAPIVVGTRRISPPELATPRQTLENGTQTIQRIFALTGQHLISDVQVDRAPISDFPAITTEIRDGAEATSITTFVDKISNLKSIGEELSTFSLDAVDLVDQTTPANSEPTPIRFVTIFDANLEEIAIRIRIDTFIKSDSATQSTRVPLRLRFRPKGSTGTWFNLPEIHLVGRDVSTSLKEIRIRWDSNFGVADTAGDISYEFFQRVPPAAFTLSDGSSGDQWQAHAHFVSGAGLTDTQNISGKRNGLRVTLDEAIFAKQEYEWEVVRGLAVNSTDLVASTYVLSGAVNSLFVAKSASAKWQVPVDQGAYVGRIAMVHAASVVDQAPCQRPKTALLALKSRGQSVRNITILASAYVRDWDGSGWDTLTTTKNPASHYYNVLKDYLEYNKIDTSLIANADFTGWRQECIDRGYEVSATYAGAPISQVLDSIATAGFARRRNGPDFGVDWFRDRSSERPVQSFSPRNATISMQWSHGEKPVGIRARFQNEDEDYRDDEIQINNSEYANFAGYEAQSYDMISNPDLIRRRVYFDILQQQYQTRRKWIIEAAIEGLVCDKGDLIGVVTDLLNDNSSGARIRKIVSPTIFSIDQDIPAQSTQSIFDEPDIFNVDDIFNVGAQSVCLVSTPTGSEMRTITAAEKTVDGNVIRVDQPFSSTDLEGAHIVLGSSSNFTSRVIVSEVRRKNEERAQLICVDEAPEIFEKLQQRFG